MNKEIMRVLKMVEEKKITAKEGAELLDALKNKERIFSGQFLKSGFAKDMIKIGKDMLKVGRTFRRSIFSDLGGTEVGELFERELEVSPEGKLLLKNLSGPRRPRTNAPTKATGTPTPKQRRRLISA